MHNIGYIIYIYTFVCVCVCACVCGSSHSCSHTQCQSQVIENNTSQNTRHFLKPFRQTEFPPPRMLHCPSLKFHFFFTYGVTLTPYLSNSFA